MHMPSRTSVSTGAGSLGLGTKQCFTPLEILLMVRYASEITLPPLGTERTCDDWLCLFVCSSQCMKDPLLEVARLIES
jgi:hypothetical protein